MRLLSCCDSMWSATMRMWWWAFDFAPTADASNREVWSRECRCQLTADICAPQWVSHRVGVMWVQSCCCQTTWSWTSCSVTRWQPCRSLWRSIPPLASPSASQSPLSTSSTPTSPAHLPVQQAPVRAGEMGPKGRWRDTYHDIWNKFRDPPFANSWQPLRRKLSADGGDNQHTLGTENS